MFITATLSAPYSSTASMTRSLSSETAAENSGASGLYRTPSTTSPPFAANESRVASRRPSPHASPRQIGTIASMPDSEASVASAAPWFVSSGARRYTLSPSMARFGAVEQQLSRSMLFSSE